MRPLNLLAAKLMAVSQPALQTSEKLTPLALALLMCSFNEVLEGMLLSPTVPSLVLFRVVG